MGNAQFNPCPHQCAGQRQHKSEILLPTIRNTDYKKHSLQIQGPSEIYKKSLRKDLDTAQLAEQIMVDWKLDQCFKQNLDSMIMTKTTQDSIFKREVSIYPPKIDHKPKKSPPSKPKK